MVIKQEISNPEHLLSTLRIAIGDLEKEIRYMSEAEMKAFTSLESSKEPIRKTISEYSEIINQILAKKITE